jgi:hypothetical protein
VSYDTSIRFPACGHCGHEPAAVEIGNMTSNVGIMYRAVLPGPYPGGGCYDGEGEPDPRGGLTGLSGLRCSEALPLLTAAVAAMRERREELRPLEPANGWGSWSGAVVYLDRIREACEEHPAGVLAVNW